MCWTELVPSIAYRRAVRRGQRKGLLVSCAATKRANGPSRRSRRRNIMSAIRRTRGVARTSRDPISGQWVRSPPSAPARSPRWSRRRACTCPTWIEREIVLPEGTSALPGKVRLWPYQRESDGMGIILIPFTTQPLPLASCGLRYHLNHCPSRYCKHQRRRASNEPGTRERYAEAGGE